MQNVTSHNAEQCLYALVEKLKVQAPTTRCAVFQISKHPDLPSNWLDTVYNRAVSILDDESLQVFVCDDGDVFMLSRQMTQKSFVKILSNPTQNNGLVSDIQELAHLFEVGYDSDVIRTLLEPKIDILKSRQNRKTGDKKGSLEEDLHKDLIPSISKRRMERDDIHILVIDDDEFSQKLVRRAVGRTYHTSCADTAHQGFQYYIRRAPDVVFLDIGLPDITGHTLLEQIRKIDPEAYIVMLSANGHSANVLEAIEKGAKGFVGKPFSPKKLEHYIQKSPFATNKKIKEVI